MLHSTIEYTALYTFCSSVHRTALSTDHMLGHITSLASQIKLNKPQINDRRKTEKFTNTWKLPNILSNNQCIK